MNTRGGAGACSPASTASTTTRSRAAISAGGRNGISPRSSKRLRKRRRRSWAARQADRRERLPRRAVRRRALSGGGSARLSEFAAWTRLDRHGRDAALLQPIERRLAAQRRGCIRSRRRSRRRSPIRWRLTLAGRPGGDSSAAFSATKRSSMRLSATIPAGDLNGARDRGPRAPGRSGFQLHAGDQRAAAFAHRAETRAKR